MLLKSATVHAAPRQQAPNHNLVFLGASFVKIAYSGPGFSRDTDGMHSFSEVTALNSKGDMIGLVARFRNEAIYGRVVEPIRGVRAHLKLFNGNMQEIGTGFSAALWLGHPNDTFDFIPSGPSGSVLICHGNDTEASVSWKSRNGVRLHDNNFHLGSEYPCRVEVTLLDSKDRPLVPPIMLQVTKESGELAVTAARVTSP